jgi:hypothetical protein
MQLKGIFGKSISAVLLFSVSLLLTHCKDKDTPNPSGNTPTGAVTAIVNNIDWASSSGNYQLNQLTITNGVGAIIRNDSLMLGAVQLKSDTSAILVIVKLSPQRLGSYKISNGSESQGVAYYFSSLQPATVANAIANYYNNGIINGYVNITAYDATVQKLIGTFNFSISAPGSTTYTVVDGKIDNVIFK